MGEDIGFTGSNLAKGQLATVSSFDARWTEHTLNPKGANDGIKNGGFAFHTLDSNQRNGAQWWQVDLGKMVKLGKIKVYNRMTDDCSGRAANLQVLFSADGNTWQALARSPAAGTVFGGVREGGDEDPLLADGNGQNARFVRMQINDGNPLHLDEVEVYEYKSADLSSGDPMAGVNNMPSFPR
jgi:hypothetical protein